MELNFQPAVKEQSTLLCAIYGPSGSGKTYTSLRLATGMTEELGQERFAVIDTEYGRASLYADRFDFDTIKMEKPKTLDKYQMGITAAVEAGYKVLVIDSLTHAWNELLEEIDRLTKSKYRGNSWSAWSEGTPKQRNFIDNYLLASPIHIIGTMRSKTEWETNKDDKGKLNVIRLGLSPIQGKGIEYEFTLLMSMSPDHIAMVEKDNTGKYQDQTINKPSEHMGKELIRWLKSGKPVEKPAPAPTPKPEPVEAPTIGPRRPAAVTDKVWNVWVPLVEEALDLDLIVENLPPTATDADVIQKGKALRDMVNQTKGE